MTPGDLTWLSTGTARARLQRAYPGHGAGRESDWPQDLARAAALFDDGGPELFFLAWELARFAVGLDRASRRALALLAFAVLAHARDGSTRLPVSGPDAAQGLEIYLDALVTPESDREGVARLLATARSEAASPETRLVGAPGAFTPLVLDGDWLTTQRLRRAEQRLVQSLSARSCRPPLDLDAEVVRSALEEVLAAPPLFAGQPVRLEPEQQRAVLGAARSPFTVVSGGPGTGKTSIVVSILRTLVRLGVPLETIALAAPTGKAAKRMEESIRRYLLAVPERGALDDELLARCPPPQTLHRLLKYSPRTDRFAHHENNRLAQKVIIVDESSMVDLFLMDRLLRSTADDARLVLLGDAEQLPSVEAGAVFRDLVPVDSESPVAIRLRRNFRMDSSTPGGRQILGVAKAVNAGDLAALQPGGEAAPAVRAAVEELRFEGVELLDLAEGKAAPDELYRRWGQERLHGLEGFDALVARAYRFDRQGTVTEGVEGLRRLFAHFDRQRLLCLTRSDATPTGAGAVNGWFHARALERLRREEGGLRGAPPFVPGEPVMSEQNDYERELFNGDQGVVVRGRDEEGGATHFMAVFARGDGFVVHPLDVLRRQLVLSYAMTVHKAQGSEFDAVTLLLPLAESPLLTREILYTALTRSRKSVVVAGSRRLFEHAVKKRMLRHSGIAAGLAAGSVRSLSPSR